MLSLLPKADSHSEKAKPALHCANALCVCVCSSREEDEYEESDGQSNSNRSNDEASLNENNASGSQTASIGQLDLPCLPVLSFLVKALFNGTASPSSFDGVVCLQVVD